MIEITTILFDVGGPLVNDDPAIDVWHEHLIEFVRIRTGRTYSMEMVRGSVEEAVQCYAPSFLSYVIWQIVKPDKVLFAEMRRECDKFPFENYVMPTPGVIDVLERLYKHFKLGIVANQPASMGKLLEEKGILKYFDSRLMSGDMNLNKPDVRIFLRVLEGLGSSPNESAMVGDRQDNDIVPAKLLGLAAIRLLVGPHKNQIVRYPKEEPDYTIDALSDLLKIPFISKKLTD